MRQGPVGPVVKDALPPKGQRGLVGLAILLGVLGFLHIQQGLGHGTAETSGGGIEHGGESHSASPSRASAQGAPVVWVVGGFGQLAALGWALVFPGRLALWGSAWLTAAIGTLDVIETAGTTRLVYSIGAAGAIATALGLVEGLGRGSRLIGLRPAR